MMIPDLWIEDHHLYFEDTKTGESTVLCEEVCVLKVSKSLPSGDETLELALWKDGQQFKFPMRRRNLCGRQFVLELVDRGLAIESDAGNYEALEGYLLEEAEKAPVEYTHSQLGFVTRNDELVYLADESVGGSGVQSHYFRPKETQPRGTLEEWKEVIRSEVEGNIELELALAIAFSAPVVHLLRESGVFAEVHLWGLIGKSSTGKTTALRLMASVYGSTAEGDLIKDFNATENAILQSLSERIGWLNLLDEATAVSNSFDWSSFIYKLSKGQTKNRCESSGQLKDRSSFTGMVVISGEASLLEQSTANQGIYARLVELELPWTKDAEHATRISQKLAENHGTAIVPFVTWLLKRQKADPQWLCSEYQKILKRLQTEAGNIPNVEERNLKQYATVLMSAQIANRSLHLNLKTRKIYSLLFEQHKKRAEERNLHEIFYDCIMSGVSANSSHFLKEKQGNQYAGNLWGEFSTKDGKKVVWISQEAFRRIAEQNGFSNFKMLLSDLEENGRICRFSDRYVTSHRLGAVKVKCYCLVVE